jgi:hypothetical protein
MPVGRPPSVSEHEQKLPTGFTRKAGFSVSDPSWQGLAHPPRRQAGQVASCQGRPLQNAGTVQTDLVQIDLVVLGTSLHRECPAARPTMRLCCCNSSSALAALSLDFLSQPLRGTLVARLYPRTGHTNLRSPEDPFASARWLILCANCECLVLHLARNALSRPPRHARGEETEGGAQNNARF